MADSDNIQEPSPPAEPVDVSVTPDPPPAGPIDLTDVVLPDPPWEPVDVDVVPEPPVAEPFDVAVTQDHAPWSAQDVPVVLAQPPLQPHDVGVGTPTPPFPTVPVSVEQPTGIRQPFDVSVETPSVPWQPVEVPTKHVIDHRIPLPGDQPVPDLDRPSPPVDHTAEGLIARLGLLDRDAAQLLESVTGIELGSSRVPGGAAMDPIVLARWLRDYINSVGPGAAGRFIAEQTSLFAMNPVVSRVFNPAYFAAMLVPGSMGHVPAAVDTLSYTMEDVVRAREVAKPPFADVKGLDSPIQPDSQQSPYSVSQPSEDGQLMDMETLVVDAIVGAGIGSPVKDSKEAGVKVRVFDASKFFTDGRGGPRTVFRRDLVAATGPTSARKTIAASKLANAAGTRGIIPAALPGELSDGTFETDTDDPSDGPTGLADDDAYVPLSFTDLRPKANGRYRTVYLRPFGLHFSESVAPEFEEDAAFGRTDPVVGYSRTVRSFDGTFECHAFAPEDLRTIHQKLFWLKSMTYPSYTTDMLLKSGPVLRMRIGDVVASGRKGASGILRSLSFDHADSLWELQQGAKVTRHIQVSLSFLVLHEGPVGFMDGEFGILSFPEVGPGPIAPGSHPGVGYVPTQQASAQVAQVMNGKFQGFGEPKKRTS